MSIKILGRFRTLTNAERFMERARMCLAIVLGDDGYIWVCPLADALAAEAAGYTLV